VALKKNFQKVTQTIFAKENDGIVRLALVFAKLFAPVDNRL